MRRKIPAIQSNNAASPHSEGSPSRQRLDPKLENEDHIEQTQKNFIKIKNQIRINNKNFNINQRSRGRFEKNNLSKQSDTQLRYSLTPLASLGSPSSPEKMPRKIRGPLEPKTSAVFSKYNGLQPRNNVNTAMAKRKTTISY